MNIKANLRRYIDVDFFLRFFFLLMALYFFNVCYIAVIEKQGMVYSAFLDHNFNYILWIKDSLLYTSNSIVRALGVHSSIYFPDHLRTINGAWVEVAYGCLGINLFCFWVAFVLANKEPFKRKITWCIAGVIGIWFINTWRIAILLIAFNNRWKVNAVLHHETKFNIIAYSLIIFMIYLFIKDGKRRLMQGRVNKVPV
ncbi:MAG: exosortase/archaeosortase family protein [Ginsengibacter sp.]